MRRYWLAVIGLVVGSAIGGAMVWLYPFGYTSHGAVVQKSANFIAPVVFQEPPSLVPVISSPALEQVLSRTSLVTCIQSYELYLGERNSMPMEDIVDIMRKAVHVDTDKGLVKISFTYSDRYKAQKVVSELTTRLINESLRDLSQSAHGTREFLHDAQEKAAAHWAELSRQARTQGASERILLDRDMAKRQYMDLGAKVAAMELDDEVYQRRMGPYIEMLEPATLPTKPDFSPYAVVALWASAGLFLGVLAQMAIQSWQRPEPVPLPAD